MKDLDLEETVILKTKNGEFKGKVKQTEVSKRISGTLYRVTIHVHQPNTETLRVPLGDFKVNKSVSNPSK